MSIKGHTLLAVYRGRLIVITDARDDNFSVRFNAYLADESMERKPPVSGK